MNGLLHLALNASFLVQLVMIILIGLSIWSWVIIFVKKKELKNILNSTNKFSQKFWSGIHMQKYYMQIKDKRKTKKRNTATPQSNEIRASEDRR